MELVNNKKWHYTIIENEILDDTDHFEKVLDKLVYIVLCRFANKKSQTAHPSIKRIALMCGCSENTVRDSLKRLERLGLISITPRKDGSTNQTNLYSLLDVPWAGASEIEGGTSNGEGGVPQILREGTSQFEPELKKDNKRNIEQEYSAEFESFWSIYPRKISKKEAFKKWKARVDAKVPVADLIQAATNYSSVCKKRGTLPEYILHPATFLGPNEKYLDYLQIDIEPTREKRKSDGDDFLTKYGFKKDRGE